MKDLPRDRISTTANSSSTHPIDRHAFLSTAAKVAGGLAVSGSLIEAARGTVRAQVGQKPTFNIQRASTVTLTCTYQGNANEAAGTQQLFDQFYAQNGRIKVKVQAIPAATWGAYFDKILTMVAGGTTPDLGRVAIEGLRLCTSKDLILPLDPFIKSDASIKEFFSDTSPKLVDTLKVNGKQYLLPVDWNELVIHYNTKLFSALGIPTPKANWTGDDFLAAGKKLVAAGKYGYNLWASSGTFFIVGWMYAAGGSLYNSDMTKCTATNPANVTAMQFLQDLVFKYKVAPRLGSPDFPLLEAGRVGMISDGRWSLNTFEVDKFHDYNVQSLPALSPSHKTIFGVGGYPIFKGSKYPEETWEAVKFMASKAAQSVGTKLGLSNPGRKSLANDPAMAVPPGVPNYNYKIYFDALAKAQVVPAPPQFNEVESALIAGFTKLMANETSASAMLAALETQINGILAKPT